MALTLVSKQDENGIEEADQCPRAEQGQETRLEPVLRSQSPHYVSGDHSGCQRYAQILKPDLSTVLVL